MPALAACAAGLALAAAGSAAMMHPAADVGYVPDTPNKATATAPAQAGAPPVRLKLPGLGLSARIVPVTIDPHANLDVPADPNVLGWWRSGASPGQGQDSVLIDGHVDSATQGIGAFARLRELHPGDPVLTESATGDVHHYRVTGRRRYPKATLPADTVFSQNVSERLVLITCGGSFNPDYGEYADNVIVFAVPNDNANKRSR